MREPFYSGGRWIYRVKRDDGREKTFTSVKEGMAGKRAVMKKARCWLDGTYIRSGRRVSDCWEGFLDYYKNIHGKEIEAYHLFVDLGKAYILPNLGKIKVEDLRYKVFQNFLFDLRLKTGELPSKSTFEVIRTALNQFIRYLVVVEEMMEPFALPLQIPPKAAGKKEKQILQPDDMKRLFSLNEWDSHYIYAFQFCSVTGLRPGELIGLRKEDIDLINNTVSISRSINERGEMTPGKNKNAVRTFAMNRIARSVIEKQLAYLEYRKVKSEWLFPNPRGAAAMQKNLTGEYKRLSFPGTVYSLRHTFISLIKYVNLPSIKRTVGHSESMPTLEVYSHVIDDGELEQDAKIITEELERRLGI